MGHCISNFYFQFSFQLVMLGTFPTEEAPPPAGPMEGLTSRDGCVVYNPNTTYTEKVRHTLVILHMK